jgi:trehalose 6-phosphate synthase
MKRLVCVSNRISLPGNAAASGGLAVGLLAAMGHTGGLWFGWSGEAVEAPAEEPQVVTQGNIRFATLDLTPAQVEDYYNGYCNGSLWPLFHYNSEVFRHSR